MLLFFICNIPTRAQISSVPDTVQYAFLPALAYNSDLGLVAGGLASRYAFQEGMKPFYSYLHANIIVSTKGLISSSFIYDKPYAYNTDIRITTESFVSRFMQNQYYGIGSYGKLTDAPSAIPDYYEYQSFSTGLIVNVRKPLINLNDETRLDLYGLADLLYFTPFDNDRDILISQDQPIGFDGALTTALGTGIIIENRDSEFNPTRGLYSKLGIETGLKALGGDANYLKLETEMSTYTTFFLIRDITFANRLSYQHSRGDLPYWKLPELGGEESMRGYQVYRFRDDNAVFMNSELRTWLFEFPELNIRLGGTLFLDIGRTYPSGLSINEVFNDLKYAFGFGGTSSLFNENFIMRGDFGFSEEGLGIYFTAGYMF